MNGRSISAGLEIQEYLNARADECCSIGLARGEPAVWFKGQTFFVIGFYFGHRAGGDRELFYILRSSTGAEGGLHPLERSTVRLLSK